MDIKKLVGSGDIIMLWFLPFAAAFIVLNVLFPQVFSLGWGTPGIIAAIVLLVVGVPVWLTSVVELFLYIPKGKLITVWPFTLMAHPIYTSVALFVLPGFGLLFDSWAGIAVGVILYIISRVFRKREEDTLNAAFPESYGTYRSKVLLPWL